MAIHQLPSWPQDHVDAVSGVVNEVTENHRQALKSISFDVEKLVGISLDHLQEYCHPLVESLIKAVAYKLVIDSICPTYGSQTQVEDI